VSLSAPDKASELVEFEHSSYGVARVVFRWVQAGEGWRWMAESVEFDLFTPVNVRETLTELLQACRLDRSVSVSAFDSHTEELPF